MCVNIAPLQTHYRKIEGALHFHARKRWEVCVFVCDDYPFVSTQKVVLQGGNYHTHTHTPTFSCMKMKCSFNFSKVCCKGTMFTCTRFINEIASPYSFSGDVKSKL